jgi:hypothetical protein
MPYARQTFVDAELIHKFLLPRSVVVAIRSKGFPLGFTNNFLAPSESATAVMIFRHKGLPYALCSAMSEKYKIGGSFKILDPETRAPAVKNPYFQPKPGVL